MPFFPVKQRIFPNVRRKAALTFITETEKDCRSIVVDIAFKNGF